MNVSEHETESARGLPEPLPAGERILWQGSPRWQSLAVRAFHTRKLAVYFLALLAWRGVAVFTDGNSVSEAAVAVLWVTPIAVTAIGMLALLAWFSSRSTVYTVTTERVVMRIGIVLTLTLNLPFRVIESAGLRTYADGTGDIPLSLAGKDKIAIIHLWPHARPWWFSRPEPMLRAIPDARRVGELLAQAIATSAVTLPKQSPAAAAERAVPIRVRRPLASPAH